MRGAGVGGSPEGIETGLGSRYRAAYLGRLLEEFEEIAHGFVVAWAWSREGFRIGRAEYVTLCLGGKGTGLVA